MFSELISVLMDPKGLGSKVINSLLAASYEKWMENDAEGLYPLLIMVPRHSSGSW